MTSSTDVAVLGAGVAGLAASIELARLGLRVTVLDRMGPGGQVMNAGVLDHVPGLAPGIRGPELIDRLVDQAIGRGVEVEFGDVATVTSHGDGFDVSTDVDVLRASGAVAALGAEASSLGVPGESSLEGRGVSYCAECDGDLFGGQDVAVVGGGDASLEAAAHLATRTREVLVVHRGSEFGATRELFDAASAHPNVRVLRDTELEEIQGDDRVGAIVLNTDGARRTVPVGAVFVAIGRRSRNDPVSGLVELDHDRRISVDASLSSRTPGLYAAGMCRSGSADQIASALGDGITAARALHAWLRATP